MRPSKPGATTQGQPAGAEMVTVPVPPPLPILKVVGLTLYVQPAGVFFNSATNAFWELEASVFWKPSDAPVKGDPFVVPVTTAIPVWSAMAFALNAPPTY